MPSNRSLLRRSPAACPIVVPAASHPAVPARHTAEGIPPREWTVVAPAICNYRACDRPGGAWGRGRRGWCSVVLCAGAPSLAAPQPGAWVRSLPSGPAGVGNSSAIAADSDLPRRRPVRGLAWKFPQVGPENEVRTDAHRVCRKFGCRYDLVCRPPRALAGALRSCRTPASHQKASPSAWRGMHGLPRNTPRHHPVT